MDAAEKADQSGNATDALKLLMVGAYRIRLAVKESQKGDPRIEQYSWYSARVAIADSQAEQLKAAGFKCMGFKPAVRFSLPTATFKIGSAELPDLLRQQLDRFA